MEFLREVLYSDHQFYSLGILPQEPINFVTLPETASNLKGTTEFEGILNVVFYYSLDLAEHQRQIYSPLDFLGDVGGLADALIAIGAITISILEIITGNPLTKYLIETIFEKDNSHKITTESNEYKLKLLSMRKRARIGLLWCNKQSKFTRS